jgi:acyl carrier protein
VGAELPATLVFDHPTILDICEFLDAGAGAGAGAGPGPGAAQPSGPAPAPAAPPAAGALAALVRAALAEVLGADVAGGISEEEPLMSSGLNSTAAVQLTSSLEARLGTQLPATLVFDYPSLRDIGDFLAGSGALEQPPAAAAAADAPAAAGAAAAAEAAPSGAASSGSLAQLVRAALADVLGAEAAGAISPSDPLMSSGLNSTAAVQLTSGLEQALAAQLPATLVFDMPSIDAICEFLQEQGLAPAAAAASAAASATAAAVPAAAGAVSGALAHSTAAPAPARAPAPAPAGGEAAVLVLATAHRAPGGALEAGAAALGARDRVRVVPLARWDVEEAVGGRGGQPLEAHSRFGAWVGCLACLLPCCLLLLACVLLGGKCGGGVQVTAAGRSSSTSPLPLHRLRAWRSSTRWCLASAARRRC